MKPTLSATKGISDLRRVKGALDPVRVKASVRQGLDRGRKTVSGFHARKGRAGPDADETADPPKPLPSERLLTLQRGEGGCSFTAAASVEGFAEADAVLREWATTIPENGPCVWCAVTVRFPCGPTATASYPLRREEAGEADLLGHLLRHWSFLSGRAAHWATPEEHQRILRANERISFGITARFEELLNALDQLTKGDDQ